MVDVKSLHFTPLKIVIVPTLLFSSRAAVFSFVRSFVLGLFYSCAIFTGQGSGGVRGYPRRLRRQSLRGRPAREGEDRGTDGLDGQAGGGRARQVRLVTAWRENLLLLVCVWRCIVEPCPLISRPVYQLDEAPCKT